MSKWFCALGLDKGRSVVRGSSYELVEALNRGGDLRIFTVFRHNEHIDVKSDNSELVEEVSEFGVTYVVDGRWAAGIMNWRQPVNPSYESTCFGPSSLSFFLYNQDGSQGIARPYLGGGERAVEVDEHGDMLNYHLKQRVDGYTNAPSSNFVYDFEEFRFFVRDDWREVLSHGSEGEVYSGAVGSLARAFSEGFELKIGIKGLCEDLAGEDEKVMEHEVFVRLGAGYYYTEGKLFAGASHPVVRVTAGVPLVYRSGGWDFGWLIVRTDGVVIERVYDPYTLHYRDMKRRCSVRWFVRQG